MTRVNEYQKDLIEALKDPEEAAAYLNAALEVGDRELFLLALRNVAEANGGMAAVADKANLNRESLYRTLSRRGNPEIRTLFNLLHGVGLRLNITPEREPSIGSYDKVVQLRESGKSLGVRDASESVTIDEAFTGYGENPLGMALREARSREGLTQRQLAEMTGMPQRHISEMESGKRPIGKERARKLAEALQVSDYRIFL